MLRSSVRSLAAITTSTTAKKSCLVYASTRNIHTTTARMTNDLGQGASHATGDSKVPESVQNALPRGAEEAAPNKLHDTGSSGNSSSSESHATGPSLVPETVQKIAPEGLEKALPEAIHPTDKH